MSERVPQHIAAVHDDLLDYSIAATAEHASRQEAHEALQSSDLLLGVLEEPNARDPKRRQGRHQLLDEDRHEPVALVATSLSSQVKCEQCPNFIAG